MLVVIDVDGFEERLIHQSAHGVWCGGVGGVTVGGEVERSSEIAGDECLVVVAAGQSLVDAGKALLDACLFVFEDFEGDGVGVAGLKELGALSHQSGTFLGQAGLFGFGFSVVLDQVVFELLLDRLA